MRFVSAALLTLALAVGIATPANAGYKWNRSTVASTAINTNVLAGVDWH